MGNQDDDRLQDYYNRVRSLFFPRWDRDRRWAIRFDENIVGDGKVVPDVKVILIKHLFADEDQTDLVIIHEICHAFGTSHGNPWIHRMEAAQRAAVRLGRTGLAEKILEELDGYANGQEPPSAAEVYDSIESAGICRPLRPFEEVVKRAAHGYPCSVDEFLCKFKRAKMFHEKGLKEAREAEELRAKHLARARR